MAKRRKKRKVARREIRHSAVRRVIHKPTKLVRSSDRKIKIAIKNLILFAVLALVSWLLYGISEESLFQNLFSLLTVVLGAIAVTFLIVLVALLFLKGMRK